MLPFYCTVQYLITCAMCGETVTQTNTPQTCVTPEQVPRLPPSWHVLDHFPYCGKHMITISIDNEPEERPHE